MSVQGGIWSFDGRAADQEFIAKLSAATTQYGPDSSDSYFGGPIAMFYRAFRTTEESHLEHQPYESRRGDVLTWDGRLDNREELIALLSPELAREHEGRQTDAAIVMAAWERWGTDSFRRLTGDFSLSVWDPRSQTLTFAKDFMGPRHLYYRLTDKCVSWCTHLETMVLLAGRSFEINGEFIAGYFDYFPPAHLTPYVGIDSVPPSTCVQIKDFRAVTRTYWSFDPSKQIRYRVDAEYEEHFREVFKTAVGRRLRADSPVLAELSGGMDSSSIVCMADALIAQGKAKTPRLDTVSYYDDDEPNWDERPYFAKVEERRGRAGTHIDMNAFAPFKPLEGDYFAALPGVTMGTLEFQQQRNCLMAAQNNRVVLSGVGGDETMGGVPSPVLGLADLLIQLRFGEFSTQLKAWSLVRRKPWTHLFLQTLVLLEPISTIRTWFRGNLRTPAPWLTAAFVARHRVFLQKESRRSRAHGLFPSQAAVLYALNGLRNQLASTSAPLAGCYEERYPYLDRDLTEFMMCIPREQVLRAGQRRSLMRRSLSQLVPKEIIDRKRKAYVVRRPLVTLGEEWPRLQILFRQPSAERLGVITSSSFCGAVQTALHGDFQNLMTLLRTVELEIWLRRLFERGVLRETAAASVLLSRKTVEKKITQRNLGI